MPISFLYKIIAKPFYVSLVIFLFFTTIISLLLIPIFNSFEEEQRNRTFRVASDKASKISFELHSRMNLNRATASFIEQNPNLDQKTFSNFVNSLLQHDQGKVISSMAYGKNFIVTLIAPLEFNKKAIGFDLFENAERYKNLQKSISYQEAFIEGPLVLEQGNVGIISYIPVYTTDSITGENIPIGTSDIIMLWDNFLKITGLNVEDPIIDFAIRGIDGTGEKGAVFYGDSAIFERNDIVKIPIYLPLGEWVLAAYSRENWQVKILPIVIFGTVALILLFSLSIYMLLKYYQQLVKKKEFKYRNIIENARDTLWTMDLNTQKYTYMSDACLQNTGYTPEEYCKYTAKEIYTPESYERIVEEINKAIARLEKSYIKKADTTFELQQYTKFGTLIWVEVSATLTINEDGEQEVVGSTRIINDRKKLESELQLLNEKYTNIAENCKDLIGIMDLKTLQYTFVNDACFKDTGYTKEEHIDLTLQNVLPPNSFEFVLEKIDEAKKLYETKKENYELRMDIQRYHKDGTLYWIEVASTVLNANYIVTIERKVDDRKQMEIELKEIKNKFIAITENSRDLIWILDAKTKKYIYQSDAASAIYGYTIDEINACEDFLSLWFPHEKVGSIRSLIAETTIQYNRKEIPKWTAVFESPVHHKDGVWRWVEVSMNGTVDKEGNLDKLYGVSRDIDDRKKLELELLSQKEELAKTNISKNKFFSIIAHDLKNPIASLTKLTKVLEDDYHNNKTEYLEDDIQMLCDTCENTYKLLEDLLNWTRSQMNAVTHTPIKTSLLTIVTDCANYLKVQATAKNIKIQNTSDEHFVICDINMIHTVLRNLISNAIKFSFNDSTIEVSVSDYSEDNNYVQVSVKDAGVGMDENTMKKLFKIDEKIVSSKGTGDESGTGLGLILCKEFIDKHNCKIWVESEIGKGTTFSFTLQKSI